jgi:uncharacterized protein (TIGR03067 family)
LRIRILLLLWVGILVNSRPSLADDADKEKESLQGNWAPITLIKDGHSIPKLVLNRLNLSIKEKSVYVAGRQKVSATYTIDPDKKASAMDITFAEGPLKGKTLLAIYSLEGEVLKICGGTKRPAAIPAKPNADSILIVLKRAKP